MAKLNFQHMIVQKTLQNADLLLNKHFWLLSVLKTVELLNIFVDIVLKLSVFSNE